MAAAGRAPQAGLIDTVQGIGIRRALRAARRRPTRQKKSRNAVSEIQGPTWAG